jgi:hypothetical protein
MLEFLQENYIKPDVLYASARDVRPFGESYHFRSGEGREEEHIFSGRIDVQSMTAVTRKGGTAVSFRLQNGPASLTARGLNQPEAVISTIRAFYNGIPMILSIILFVAFVTTFRLDRDLKSLRKGEEK